MLQVIARFCGMGATVCLWRNNVTNGPSPPDSEARQKPIVLIANDQEWSARSLESILVPEGYEVIRAYTGRQALERARAVLPDLIVLDAQMPDLDGFEVCRLLRGDRRFDAVTPIVITTAGPAGREKKLEALSAGAWSFFGQPLDGDILLRQFAIYLDSKRAFDEACRRSVTDPLTGLYNLRGIQLRVREMWSDAKRQHAPIACVVLTPELPEGLELNGATERIAKQIGETLRRSGRSADAIGRVERLEFIVIAAATGAEGAEKLARRFDALLQAATREESIPEVPSPLRFRSALRAVPDSTSDDPLELVAQTRAALAEIPPAAKRRVS